MKLRNKKTGEIVKGVSSFDTREFKIGIEYENNKGYLEMTAFNSLAELNEYWEDYTPKEPLIKDEKVRKAVRAWAEANDIDSSFYRDTVIKFNPSEHRFTWIDTSIEFDDIAGLENLKAHKSYTIAELCGKDEDA